MTALGSSWAQPHTPRGAARPQKPNGSPVLVWRGAFRSHGGCHVLPLLFEHHLHRTLVYLRWIRLPVTHGFVLSASGVSRRPVAICSPTEDTGACLTWAHLRDLSVAAGTFPMRGSRDPSAEVLLDERQLCPIPLPEVPGALGHELAIDEPHVVEEVRL